MITDTHKDLYWCINQNELLGYPPGFLVCVSYSVGGGFAGAPEEITMALRTSIPDITKQPENFRDFPDPCTDIEYTIGGRKFIGCNYHDARRG